MYVFFFFIIFFQEYPYVNLAQPLNYNKERQVPAYLVEKQGSNDSSALDVCLSIHLLAHGKDLDPTKTTKMTGEDFRDFFFSQLFTKSPFNVCVTDLPEKTNSNTSSHITQNHSLFGKI